MSALDISTRGGNDRFDALDILDEGGDASTAYIHIRNQQRNGRKSLTTIEGLSTAIDAKKLLRAFKKELNCNGTIVADSILGPIIQLTGDQRTVVQQFLVREHLATKDGIKVHGA